MRFLVGEHDVYVAVPDAARTMVINTGRVNTRICTCGTKMYVQPITTDRMGWVCPDCRRDLK